MRIRTTSGSSFGAGEPRLYALAMVVMLVASLAWLGEAPANAGDHGGQATAISE